MRTKNVIRLCLLASIGGGLLSALLRTIALLNNYNVESGHFDLGESIHLVDWSWAVALLVCAACGVACFLFRNRLGGFERVPRTSYIVGATALIFTILLTIFESLSEERIPGTVESSLNMIIAVVGGMSCATILGNAFIPSNKVNLIRASVSLVPAIFIVMPGYRSYFDAGLIMNCPNKSVYIIAACFASVMIITECRFNCPKPSTALFTASCCATVVTGMFCGIPNIVYFAVNRVPLLTGFGPDFAILGFAVFAMAQLCSLHHKIDQ